MNSNSSRFPSLPVRRSQFSPLGSRHTQAAMAALRRLPSRTLNAVPAADSLTPATPVLRDFWNPHLIDRLQMPLSRVRE